ncbi:MAG TPA: dephospho-CoA kinase [Phenylobacterium sp.]
MIVIGLTGSIGMGKSTTAKMFEEEGVPVYDADAEVHRLYAKGGAGVAPVEAAFPGVSKDGAIDREALGKRVLNDPDALRRLQSIVYPLMESRQGFLARAKADGKAMAVLDIPLLFETGGERNVDAVVVASAPAQVQHVRVLDREGMTEEKLQAILAKQLPDAEKRKRADFIVETGEGFEAARAQVRQIIAALNERSGQG